MSKRIVLALVGLVVLALSAAWLLRGEIALRAMARAMDRNLAAAPADG
ncbi:MAG: hypothetical protein IM658_09360, partial [Phenylobacterium sp.]|nr:hypothetical protein [Phenylobacterium sp.]